MGWWDADWSREPPDQVFGKVADDGAISSNEQVALIVHHENDPWK
jgi:hypothetical protein